MGYAERVAHAIEGLKFVSTGVCPTCRECQKQYGMPPQKFYALWQEGKITEDGAFSWDRCGLCNAPPGDRYLWHGTAADTGKLLHFDDACPDCVCYLANGDLPRDEAEHAA